jgi:hypothetical protein
MKRVKKWQPAKLFVRNEPDFISHDAFHESLPRVTRRSYFPTERRCHIRLCDNYGRICMVFDHAGVIFIAGSFFDLLPMELESLFIAITVSAAEPIAKQLARGSASYL